MQQKKYSIHSNQNKIKKEQSKVDKIYKKNRGLKMYLIAISVFSIAFLSIIISPLFTGKRYDFETVELNSPKNIASSLNLSVDDMELNKENGLFKIVLRYYDDTGFKSLSNLESEYKLNFINNKGKSETKTTIVKVSDEFTTIYFENLPKNFGVLSISVKPRYVYPELEPSDDLKEKEIKFYAVDKDIPENNKLKVQSESVIRKESFKYQIKSVDKLIEEEKENINRFYLSNEINKKDIEKTKQNLEFETLEEQIASKSKISSMETTIKNNGNKIKEAEEKIKQYEEKIEHLKKVSKNFGESNILTRGVSF